MTLGVELVHRVPGRMRVRLTRPPKNVNDMLTRIYNHDGIMKLTFNPVSISIVSVYSPSIISSTEILLRIAIALSIEYHSRVKITVHKKVIPMTPLDYYSGASILGALIGNMLPLQVTGRNILSYNAGLSTTASVLKHAWYEVKHEGIYDPEVVSVVYLINSLLKGNMIFASAVTWGATFGRHLITNKEEACYLKALDVVSSDNQTYTDVQVQQEEEVTGVTYPLRLVINGLSRIVGIEPENVNLMDSIRKVSKAHHDILESVDRKNYPVYLKVDI